MLKKILKAMLAASLFLGLTNIASANVKVYGDISEYLGQYNSGAKDYQSHFQSAGEAHLNAWVSEEDYNIFFQIEVRDEKNASTTTNHLHNAFRYISYKKNDLTITLGTVPSGGTCEYAAPSGLKSWATTKFGAYAGCLGWHEGDGIKVEYAISAIEGKMGLSFQPNHEYKNVYYHYPAPSYVKTYVPAKDFVTNESVASLYGSGKIAGMVAFLVDYTTIKTDSVTVKDDTALNDVYTHLGVKADLGSPDMTLSFDLSNMAREERKFDPWGTGGKWPEHKRTDMALQFRMKELMVGDLIATYVKRDNSLGGEKAFTRTNTGVVYRMPISKTFGVDLFYISENFEYNSSFKKDDPEQLYSLTAKYVYGTEDSFTKTWMGGGLFAKF